MIKKLIIIKLGGGLITYKNSPTPRLKTKVLIEIVNQIKKLNYQGYSFVIIHGAGSFGHPLAKKYRINEGVSTEEQLHAAINIQLTMQQLSLIIANQFHKVGLNPQVIPTHCLVSQDNTQFKDFPTEIIKQTLTEKTIPILYGDVVMDRTTHFSIISGDTLVGYLAKQLKANQVIFLSDVDGVYNQDPKTHKQAQKFSIINDQNVNEILVNIKQNNPNDVSGEMAGKIKQIKKFLGGIEVGIASGLLKDNLSKAIHGRAGTKLKLN